MSPVVKGTTMNFLNIKVSVEAHVTTVVGMSDMGSLPSQPDPQKGSLR